MTSLIGPISVIARQAGRVAAALTFLLLGANMAAAAPVKIGYWSSGFSVGFGAVLEEKKFVQQAGLDAEFIRFADVNGPTKAILTNSIDIAFAASAAGALNLAADGAPIKIVLATQIAEGQFVVLDDSPVRALADLKGKKIGMSPVGSATYALASAILESNFGLKPSDYTVVPGNEAVLAQYLRLKEIDAAALRAVTIAEMRQTKLRTLGSLVEEWHKLTKSDAPPVLALTMVHENYLKRDPAGTAAFIRAVRNAVAFGGQNVPAVAEILEKVAHLPADDATAYAQLWDSIYIARFGDDDVAALKRMVRIFQDAGTIKKPVPEAAFLTQPYRDAIAAAAK